MKILCISQRQRNVHVYYLVNIESIGTIARYTSVCLSAAANIVMFSIFLLFYLLKFELNALWNSIKKGERPFVFSLYGWWVPYMVLFWCFLRQRKSVKLGLKIRFISIYFEFSPKIFVINSSFERKTHSHSMNIQIHIICLMNVKPHIQMPFKFPCPKHIEIVRKECRYDLIIENLNRHELSLVSLAQISGLNSLRQWEKENDQKEEKKKQHTNIAQHSTKQKFVSKSAP